MEMETGRAITAIRGGSMTSRILARGLHLIMALYLTASAVELLDRSGLAADHPVVGETAQTLRDVRSGDDPFGIADELERTVRSAQRLAEIFTEAGDALN